jgi:hypothetical protein
MTLASLVHRINLTAVCITIVKNATFNRAPKNASDPFHDLQPINNLRTTTLEWERSSLNYSQSLGYLLL